MSGEMTVPKTFAERLKDRIKDSASDLITDEELAEMVKRTLNTVFFERVLISKGYGSTPDKYSDPLIHGIVKDLMKEAVKEAVEKWIVDNPEEVKQALSSVLETSASELMLKAVSDVFSSQVSNFQMELQKQVYSIQNRLANGG